MLLTSGTYYPKTKKRPAQILIEILEGKKTFSLQLTVHEGRSTPPAFFLPVCHPSEDTLTATMISLDAIDELREQIILRFPQIKNMPDKKED